MGVNSIDSVCQSKRVGGLAHGLLVGYAVGGWDVQSGLFGRGPGVGYQGWSCDPDEGLVVVHGCNHGLGS